MTLTGYRFSYITKQNERKKLLSQISKEADESKKASLISIYNNLEPRFTIAASQLPNSKIPCFNMFSKLKVDDVSYDLVMYDTYDYIDKVWGFCLMDIYYAAFNLYYDRTGDERGKTMAKYIRYSTIDDKEIWLIRYGYDFEDIEWIKPHIKKIDEKCIEFNDSIEKLDEEQLLKISKYI